MFCKSMDLVESSEKSNLAHFSFVANFLKNCLKNYFFLYLGMTLPKEGTNELSKD